MNRSDLALAADLTAALDPAQLAARVGMVPDQWQLDVLRSTDRRIALVIGRQCGKTQTAAILAVHQAAYTPNSLVLMVAPTMRQSQELFRRSLQLYRAIGRPVASEQENALSLTLENGSRIVSLPGDEKTIRGFAGADLLLLDEAARIEDALMGAVQPMVAISGGRLLAMSTPWGRRGWFYEATTDPSWTTITVRSDECPRWSIEDLDEFRRQRGDWLYRQEILAEFIDASGQMFRSDDIEAAFEAGELDATDFAPLFGHDGHTALTHLRPEVLTSGDPDV